MIKVSVIIPVYNAEKYLRQCLDSVVCQTLTDIEIICVDDGSTDSSLAILREYEKRDARLKVLTQVNSGAGAARNAGLAIARGEYLSFLDADDFFEPDMLRTAYDRAKVTDADVVVFRCDQYIEETGVYENAQYSIHRNLLPKEEPFAGADIERDVFKAFIGWPWDKLFRAEFVRENGLLFQNTRTTNDMLFVFSALLKAERIATSNAVLAHHRMAENTLSVTREVSWGCFYEALIALREQLRMWNIYEVREQDFINYSLHFALWNLETLREPSYTKLYNRLREEWFTDLGITGKPEDYFYSGREYRMYKFICSNEIDKLNGKTVSDFIQIGVFSRTVRYFRAYGLAATVAKIAYELGLK